MGWGRWGKNAGDGVFAVFGTPGRRRTRRTRRTRRAYSPHVGAVLRAVVRRVHAARTALVAVRDVVRLTGAVDARVLPCVGITAGRPLS